MKEKVLLFILFVALFVAGCGGKKDKNTISVMTLNIRYNNPDDSVNAWPNRADQVWELINEEQPDIFGLQEVLWDQYALLDSVLVEYSSQGVGRDDGFKGGEMNPVFYRKDKFDLVRTITFWLSETPDFPGSKSWGSSLPRIVTWMELVMKDSDKHLFFFNTHFAHDSDSARIMSSQLLLNRVAETVAGFPFIITGDFNMLPGTREYSILTGPEAGLSILRDSYTVSEERPEGPVCTFNGFSDKPGAGRIDYIFVKNGLKVYEHNTLIRKDEDVFISDHWPVISTVSVK